MKDLGQWLREQLDEDERIAREAAAKAAAELATSDRLSGRFEPPYDGTIWVHDYDHIFVAERKTDRVRRTEIADCGHGAFALTPHIAEWDPARVLREIDAKRGLVASYERAWNACARLSKGGIDIADVEEWKRQDQTVLALKPHVQNLAALYAARPGYREKWRPS